jgi:hypothetical protein
LNQKPVEAGMVSNVEEYVYSSSKDYVNQKEFLEIEILE